MELLTQKRLLHLLPKEYEVTMKILDNYWNLPPIPENQIEYWMLLVIKKFFEILLFFCFLSEFDEIFHLVSGISPVYISIGIDYSLCLQIKINIQF